MKNQNQPWLNDAGNEIPTEQLREISKQWDAQTWEEYLNWYESSRNQTQDEPNAKASKPWLGANGKFLEDDVLQEISKEWTSQIWEQFLDDVIEVCMSRNETLVNDYNSLTEEVTEGIWEQIPSLPLEVQSKVRGALKQLSPVQRKIINGIFFKDLSQSAVARSLGVTHQTVNESKKISLKKIKELLENDPAVAAYLIGGSEKMAHRQKSREEEIREVYREDLKGSYIK